jgi:hypothetical protein
MIKYLSSSLVRNSPAPNLDSHRQGLWNQILVKINDFRFDLCYLTSAFHCDLAHCFADELGTVNSNVLCSVKEAPAPETMSGYHRWEGGGVATLQNR